MELRIESLPLIQLRDVDVRRRIRPKRQPIPFGLVAIDAADDITKRCRRHLEFVAEDALDPDADVGAVKEHFADRFAREIARRRDAAIAIYEHRRVAEEPHRKNRNGDERRIVEIERAEIEGQPHFRSVKLAVLEQTLEYVRREQRLMAQLDSFGAHAAVRERARAIVISGCDVQLERNCSTFDLVAFGTAS